MQNILLSGHFFSHNSDFLLLLLLLLFLTSISFKASPQTQEEWRGHRGLNPQALVLQSMWLIHYNSATLLAKCLTSNEISVYITYAQYHALPVKTRWTSKNIHTLIMQAVFEVILAQRRWSNASGPQKGTSNKYPQYLILAESVSVLPCKQYRSGANGFF